jgi:hypothetical protein
LETASEPARGIPRRLVLISDAMHPIFQIPTAQTFDDGNYGANIT